MGCLGPAAGCTIGEAARRKGWIKRVEDRSTGDCKPCKERCFCASGAVPGASPLLDDLVATYPDWTSAAPMQLVSLLDAYLGLQPCRLLRHSPHRHQIVQCRFASAAYHLDIWWQALDSA